MLATIHYSFFKKMERKAIKISFGRVSWDSGSLLRLSNNSIVIAELFANSSVLSTNSLNSFRAYSGSWTSYDPLKMLCLGT